MGEPEYERSMRQLSILVPSLRHRRLRRLSKVSTDHSGNPWFIRFQQWRAFTHRPGPSRINVSSTHRFNQLVWRTPKTTGGFMKSKKIGHVTFKPIKARDHVCEKCGKVATWSMKAGKLYSWSKNSPRAYYCDKHNKEFQKTMQRAVDWCKKHGYSK